MRVLDTANWPHDLARNGEPLCCDQPMIHNSYTEEYECADAFFVLQDDGIFPEGDTAVHVDEAALTDDQQERYRHWLARRVPDANLGDHRG